jgi:hypothetical protein
MPRELKTLGDVRDTGQSLLAICRNIRCRRRHPVNLDLLIDKVGSMHSLLPVRGQVHFSERMRCPDCGERGMFIWLGIPREPMPMMSGMSYSVNNWMANDYLLSTLAQSGHVMVARAAYDAAVIAYPSRRITLQQGGFVLEDNRFRVVKGGRG